MYQSESDQMLSCFRIPFRL